MNTEKGEDTGRIRGCCHLKEGNYVWGKEGEGEREDGMGCHLKGGEGGMYRHGFTWGDFFGLRNMQSQPELKSQVISHFQS